jgi:hypothetical protein
VDPDPAFYLNADPDPAFELNADPNPGSQTDADPYPDLDPGSQTNGQTLLSKSKLYVGNRS